MYVPSLQFVQAVAPAPEYLPVGHGYFMPTMLPMVLVTPSQKLPAGHVAQLVPPDVVEKVVGGHVVQAVALARENVPQLQLIGP